MNTLKLFPRVLRGIYEKNMNRAGVENIQRYHSSMFFGGVILSAIISLAVSFFKYGFSNLLFNLLLFVGIFIFLQILFFINIILKAGSTVKKMEAMFPDFIQMMASNLRAGMTVDKALLLSARPEFYPLDKEISKAGKEIATGKDIMFAMSSMSKRIGSEKISKTISLIMSGLRAGGNISTLLEQTASNMREKEFIEKRAASNITMYVIFIFFAVGIGAPVLFGLSSVLVEIIMKMIASVPASETSQMSLPISFKAVEISPTFLIYFSVAFIVVIDIITSLVIGLVNKGEEKAGLKYILPLIGIGLTVFFLMRILLSGVLGDLLSGVG